MRPRSGWAVAVVIAAAGCSSAGTTPVANRGTPPAAVTQHRPTHHSTRHPMPTFSPTASLVSEAHWVRYPEGWRIEVMPSVYGRNHSPEAVAQTLAEALRLAPPPVHLTPTMRRSLYNQLECHADFAPRKPLWDLESWRPNVGYYRTVEALCNPGGGF